MINYIIRRTLLMIPTLLGITILVFLIVRFAPGNPLTAPMMAGAISSDARAATEDYYQKKTWPRSADLETVPQLVAQHVQRRD